MLFATKTRKNIKKKHKKRLKNNTLQKISIRKIKKKDKPLGIILQCKFKYNKKIK